MAIILKNHPIIKELLKNAFKNPTTGNLIFPMNIIKYSNNAVKIDTFTFSKKENIEKIIQRELNKLEKFEELNG